MIIKRISSKNDQWTLQSLVYSVLIRFNNVSLLIQLAVLGKVLSVGMKNSGIGSLRENGVANFGPLTSQA